jgi:hypothetical protein
MHNEIGKNDDNSYLGLGFSNDRQTIVKYDKKGCFSGNVTTDGITVKNEFDKALDHRALETAIGVNASNTKVDWGVFST